MLDAARGQVVRTVNAATVTTYWHIGRELVEAVQQGDERAAYGKALIARLAERLTERYGKGYSATNLAYFRQFYLTYADRIFRPPVENPPTPRRSRFPTRWVENLRSVSTPTSAGRTTARSCAYPTPRLAASTKPRQCAPIGLLAALGTR